jgi:hypothetical protein
MTFDREALRGIFAALSSAEQQVIGDACDQRNIRRDQNWYVIDDDLHIVQEVMVELGYIASFEVPLSEQWAEEYEEIMAIQDLVS